MKTKAIALIAALSFVAACQQTRSDVEEASNIAGGRCEISKNFTDIMCFDFAEDYDANTASTDCTNLGAVYVASQGANGQDFLSGNANRCDTGGTVGTCTTSAGVMYYYSSHWSSGNAQTDCSSTLSGTWQ